MSLNRFLQLLAFWAGTLGPIYASSDLAGGKNLEAAREFWSYRPLGEVKLPDVKDESWLRTEVDRFIVARQEAAKVQPNDPASPHTLMRRASFDLRGLPPTPEEVENFEQEA
ncbi:uncharacterized protein METZ01_LOCUS306734, partial [marine metagenome]